MTMGWMETIRLLGLDLQVATVLAGASLDMAVRVPWSAAALTYGSRWQAKSRARASGRGVMGSEQRTLGAAP